MKPSLSINVTTEKNPPEIYIDGGIKPVGRPPSDQPWQPIRTHFIFGDEFMKNMPRIVGCFVVRPVIVLTPACCGPCDQSDVYEGNFMLSS